MMQHCKEAVQAFVQLLLLNKHSSETWDVYQNLLVEFQNQDDFEEALAIYGGYETFINWMNQRESVKYEFVYHEKMGIEIPKVYVEWEELTVNERENLIDRWETIRGHIPDRILALDSEVEKLQSRVYQEEDWEEVCRLFDQISSFASTINELNIWYRKQQEV